MQRRVERVTLSSLLLAGMIATSLVLVTLERREISGIAAITEELDEAARAYIRTEIGAITQVRWIALGLMAGLLVAGIVALTPMAQVQAIEEPARPSLASTAHASAEAPPERVQPLRPAGLDADLLSVARLCTDLSRVATTEALPDLLARSAAVLDASGLILWVGVGDALVPVLGHGYPADTISHLGPVARTDGNAAATAWRTGERVTVSGTPGKAGAIVVPLQGVDGCLGVLACEVPPGREHDPVTQAIAELIAAQLATVVPRPQSESPTASSDEAPADVDEPRAHSA